MSQVRPTVFDMSHQAATSAPAPHRATALAVLVAGAAGTPFELVGGLPRAAGVAPVLVEGVAEAAGPVFSHLEAAPLAGRDPHDERWRRWFRRRGMSSRTIRQVKNAICALEGTLTPASLSLRLAVVRASRATLAAELQGAGGVRLRTSPPPPPRALPQLTALVDSVMTAAPPTTAGALLTA
jgi:hypothetical protein